jgi:hypothetical protein
VGEIDFKVQYEKQVQDLILTIVAGEGEELASTSQAQLA